jgi:hypothetical protein
LNRKLLEAAKVEVIHREYSHQKINERRALVWQKKLALKEVRIESMLIGWVLE